MFLKIADNICQVFVRALRQLISDQCEPYVNSTRELRQCVSGPELLGYMKNASFIGRTGHVKFDQSGDLIGNYVLRQLLKVGIKHWILNKIILFSTKKYQLGFLAYTTPV